MSHPTAQHHYLEGLFGLEGSAAFVTGAAGGLGLAMARALALAGAHVRLADVDEAGLAIAVESLVAEGAHASSVVIDAGDTAQVRDAIEQAARDAGPLRIVIAIAGISAGPGPLFPGGLLEDLDWDRWHEVLRVNLTGVMATIKAASSVIPSDGTGRIIAVSSIAGVRTEAAVGYAYAATKAGVVALVRQAAVDCARRHITVNAIAPGPFDTSLGGGRIREDAVRDYFTRRTALGEVAAPEDIAGLALYLSSPASLFVTGATFTIDGGSL